MKVHYHFIIEKMWQQQIKLRLIKTDNQIADVFTNSLGNGKFEFFRHQLNEVKGWLLEVQGMAADVLVLFCQGYLWAVSTDQVEQ